MMTQKEIAKILDIASTHATNQLNQTGSTGKQNWFLAKLIYDKSNTEVALNATLEDIGNALTKKRASWYIDMLLSL